MSPDIILYAIIAIVLLARLWALFGHRNDGDTQRTNPFATPAPERRDLGDAQYPIAANKMTGGSNPRQEAFKSLLPPTSLAGGLDQVAAIYPAFNEKEFLQDARSSFTAIVTHFAAGDLGDVEKRLDPEVLKRFRAAIEARKSARQRLDCAIHAVTDAEIIAARADDKRAFVTTRFVSEQTIKLNDAQGQPINGEAPTRETVTDDWVFMRDTALPDGSWILVEAKS